MSKKNWIILLVVVLVIATSLFLYLRPIKAKDFILDKEGNVEVLIKDEWVEATETEYKKLLAVKTNTGIATLRSFKSSIINMEDNSEIKLNRDNNYFIVNVTGKTKHKFLSLNEISNYKLLTSAVDFEAEKSSFVLNSYRDRTEFILIEGLTSFEEISPEPLEKIIFYTNGSFEYGNLSVEENKEILNYTKETLNNMKDLRKDLISEYNNVVKTIQSMTGTTDEDLEKTLLDVDEGKVDQEDLIDKSPISLPKAIEDLKSLNDEIKSQQELIKTLEGSLI